MPEHVSDESDHLEARERYGVALVVFDRPAAARCPRERSFHDPASWQQNETSLCLRQLDDVQLDALCGGSIGGRFSRAALA
jgi:hypothetical protein